MRTPQIVLAPIGTAFPALSIPGVGQVRGVLIDNPSGAWLLLRPTNDYIPPYTLGWARSFVGGVASVDLVYQAPAGQVSTLQGDPAVLVLDTEPVPDSAGVASGSAFVQGFIPTLQYVGVMNLTMAGAILGQVVIAPVANRQLRIIDTQIYYTGNNGAAIGWDRAISPVVAVINSSPGGQIIATLRLGTPNHADRITFNPTLPLVSGRGVEIGFAQTAFAAVSVGLAISYQAT